MCHEVTHQRLTPISVQLLPGAVYWPDAGLYNITGNCQNLQSLPNITVTFGGQDFDIPPALWVIKVDRFFTSQAQLAIMDVGLS